MGPGHRRPRARRSTETRARTGFGRLGGVPDHRPAARGPALEERRVDLLDPVALDLEGRRDEVVFHRPGLGHHHQAVELLVRVEPVVDRLRCSASEASSAARPSGPAARWAASGFSIAMPSGWPRLAPVTTQASTARFITSRSSMGAGATYLPLLVLNRSLTRPVMRRLPSASSAPLSPVCSQPSAVDRPRRSAGLLVVAEHHARALASGSRRWPGRCGTRRRRTAGRRCRAADAAAGWHARRRSSRSCRRPRRRQAEAARTRRSSSGGIGAAPPAA